MFFLIERKGKDKVQSPVITGYGDCRTCTFVTNLCADRENCCTNEGVCCWLCPKLLECLKAYIEDMVDVSGLSEAEVVRELFGVSSPEVLYELVDKLRKRIAKYWVK